METSVTAPLGPDTVSDTRDETSVADGVHEWVRQVGRPLLAVGGPPADERQDGWTYEAAGVGAVLVHVVTHTRPDSPRPP